MDRANSSVRQGKRTAICGLSLIMLVAIVTACLQPLNMISLPEQSSSFQAESPLVSEEFLSLTKNPWRVITIIYQNETAPFDAIQPIYVKIWPDGISAETGCNHLGFGIIAQDEQSYRLTEGNTTQALCPDPQMTQYALFFTTLSITTQFELQADQLILIGDESRIVLEATHPFSLANPVFTQNRWQLLEIIHEGQPVIFDAIRPIYLQITGDGYLHFKTEQCNIGTFHMDIKSDEYYRFDMSAHTAYECPQIPENQSYDVFWAVSRTNTLKLNGTQLLLTGPETRVVLEVDHAQ